MFGGSVTADEYKQYESAHVMPQPQVSEARAEQAYRNYCAFAQRTGVKKPLSRPRYELALNMVGFVGETKED